MKGRHAYPLLFLLPSVMVAGIATVLAAVAGGGVLWLFVYGDNRWPASADTTVMAVATSAGLVLLALLLFAAHRFGKRRETQGGVARSHMLVALGLSVGLAVLVLLHQWGIGNLGGEQVPPGNSSKPTPLRGAG